MAGPSPIQWTEHTWNPIVGCSLVSPGCTNCYAMRQAWRFKKSYLGRKVAGPPAENVVRKVNGNPVWTGQLAHAPDYAFLAPLARKKPTIYFVNSMSDLFHEHCPDEWIDRVFAVMALSPQHTFQVLTKRAARMRSYNADEATPYRIARACLDLAIAEKAKWTCDPWPVRSHGAIDNPDDVTMARWPLPNVWLGVSCENQEQADARIPLLLQTPAAVRFVSAEPLLGPIDLTKIEISGDAVLDALTPRSPAEAWRAEWDPAVTGTTLEEAIEGFKEWFNTDYPPSEERGPKLDWVIAGGESGPKARPMHPDWARGLRDMCKAAGVAFHFKQWGEFASTRSTLAEFLHQKTASRLGERIARDDGTFDGFPAHGVTEFEVMRRVGKKAAGRLLDGVEHNAFPAGRG